MRALGYFRVDAATQADGAEKTAENFEEDFAEYCILYLHQQIETFGDLGPSEDGSYAEYDRLLEYIRESGSNFLVTIPDASHLGPDIETVARSFLEVETGRGKGHVPGREHARSSAERADPLGRVGRVEGPQRQDQGVDAKPGHHG